MTTPMTTPMRLASSCSRSSGTNPRRFGNADASSRWTGPVPGSPGSTTSGSSARLRSGNHGLDPVFAAHA
jgi:hypothetical protein